MTMLAPPPSGGSQSPAPESTSLRQGSHVSHSVKPASNEESPTSDGGGPGLRTSFAQYDPATSSWRTSQLSFEMPTPSDGCSVTWPDSGSMRNGRCYEHRTLERPTSANGSFSWPTPRATMARIRTNPQRPGRSNLNLEEAVGNLGGPVGYLNPTFVEWLMGFPRGWTRSE